MKNIFRHFLIMMLLSCSTELVSTKNEISKLTLKADWISGAQTRQQIKSINPLNNIRVSKQYKALELSITNKSMNNYLLSHKNMSVPCENPHTIKTKLKVNTSALPVVAGIAVPIILMSAIGLAIVPSLVVGLVACITTASIDTQSVNKTTGNALHNAGIDLFHPIMIESCSTVKKIVFIRKKYLKQDFTLKLQNCLDQSLISFTIKIP